MRILRACALLRLAAAVCTTDSQYLDSSCDDEAVMSVELLQTDRLVIQAKAEVAHHETSFAGVKHDFSDLVHDHAGKRLGLAAIKQSPESIAPEGEGGGGAAAESGVAMNADDDIYAFIAALIANGGTCIACIFIFMALRNHFPMIYSNNVVGAKNRDGKHVAPVIPPNTTFGWLHAAWHTTTDENARAIGLDNALLIEFADLCMKILAIIGIPLVCIEGPLNCFFGRWAAGQDYLSYLSFGNVAVEHPWLYYVHAGFIWYVVIAVQTCVYESMKKFLHKRVEWLKSLPEARANTILVENIPEGKRSDKKVKEFFERMMGRDSVSQVWVVKNTSKLLDKIAEKEIKDYELKALPQDAPAGREEAIKNEIAALKGEIVEAREEVRKGALSETSPRDGAEDVNLSKAFVTFKDRKNAQIAMSVQYDEDSARWVTSTPPEPSDILWADLTADPSAQAARDVIGYALVVGLYFAYMPLVIGISQVAGAVNMGPMQSAWEGLAPTMGLQFMVAFLPTFLLLIFRQFFILKADAYSQNRLQNWYFWFQVVFVIMVTAIGDSVVDFTRTLFESPFEVFPLLADTMPHATHFYMNFLVLQWTTHCMNLLRYVPLSKFLGFRQIWEEEEARAKSEPEDQDYYGLGSRSARFTINMLIGIIYSTLSPGIAFLAWVNFAVCRVVYGYLIPFAETKKPDLGGVFFVRQLQHIFTGNVIYCIMMTGVLFGRAPNIIPGVIVTPTIFYVLWSLERFNEQFTWESLPFERVAEPDKEVKKRFIEGEYKQPEMTDSK